MGGLGLCEDNASSGSIRLMKDAVDEWIDSHGASVTRSGHVVGSHTGSRQGQLPVPPLLA